MKFIIFCSCLLFSFYGFSYKIEIKGSISLSDSIVSKKVDVFIIQGKKKIIGEVYETGKFHIHGDLMTDSIFYLMFKKKGFITKSIAFYLSGDTSNLNKILPFIDLNLERNTSSNELVICVARFYNIGSVIHADEDYAEIQKVKISNNFARNEWKQDTLIEFFENGDTVRCVICNKEFTGTLKVYFENGGLKKEIPFFRGKLNGAIRTYYSNGFVLSEKLYSMDGFVDGDQYFPNGDWYKSITHGWIW